MGALNDWFEPNSPSGILAIILGFVGVLALANEAPYVLLVLVALAFLGWVGVRSGLLNRDEVDGADTTDPLVILQQRYASGDLSKEEFERRVDELLEVDARVMESDHEMATERR